MSGRTWANLTQVGWGPESLSRSGWEAELLQSSGDLGSHALSRWSIFSGSPEVLTFVGLFCEPSVSRRLLYCPAWGQIPGCLCCGTNENTPQFCTQSSWGPPLLAQTPAWTRSAGTQLRLLSDKMELSLPGLEEVSAGSSQLHPGEMAASTPLPLRLHPVLDSEAPEQLCALQCSDFQSYRCQLCFPSSCGFL